MTHVHAPTAKLLVVCSLFLLAALTGPARAELPSKSKTDEENAAIMADIQKSYDDATRVVKGSTSPEEIPQKAKYSELIRFYEEDHQSLSKALSSEDDAVLREASANDKYVSDQQLLWYKQSFAPICASMKDANGYALAEQVQVLVEQADKVRLQQYEQILNQLSKAGRQQVDDYIDQVITPRLTVTLVDSLKIAKAHPDLYKLKMEHRCYYYRNGVVHPDVQAAIDAIRSKSDDEGLILQESSSSYSAEFE